MVTKHVFCWLLLGAFGLSLLPHTGIAAQWTVSPFRAQMAQGPSEESAAADTTVAVHSEKRNVGKALMFSLIIPGAGQLYAGRWWHAVPWFVVEVASWAAFANYHGAGQDKTDEFEAYAGWRDTPNNFHTLDYLWAEYKVATDTVRAREVYNGNFDDWTELTWADREPHLPPPFTHDVLTTDRQQFFEMIGKYFSQFGWGWLDTHNGGQRPASGSWGQASDWTQAAPGLVADNTATIAFDGGSTMFFHYAGMRGDANDLLDKGNTFMEIVLVNHMLSALHAGFQARLYNKRLERTPVLGDLKLRYDIRRLDGEPTRLLSLSVPLD